AGRCMMRRPSLQLPGLASLASCTVAVSRSHISSRTYKKPATGRTPSPRLASAQQDVITGSHSVRMEQSSLTDHIADGGLEGRQHGALQVLAAPPPELLDAGKLASGLDDVGQKDDLLKP